MKGFPRTHSETNIIIIRYDLAPSVTYFYSHSVTNEQLTFIIHSAIWVRTGRSFCREFYSSFPHRKTLNIFFFRAFERLSVTQHYHNNYNRYIFCFCFPPWFQSPWTDECSFCAEKRVNQLYEFWILWNRCLTWSSMCTSLTEIQSFPWMGQVTSYYIELTRWIDLSSL